MIAVQYQAEIKVGGAHPKMSFAFSTSWPSAKSSPTTIPQYWEKVPIVIFLLPEKPAGAKDGGYQCRVPTRPTLAEIRQYCIIAVLQYCSIAILQYCNIAVSVFVDIFFLSLTNQNKFK